MTPPRTSIRPYIGTGGRRWFWQLLDAETGKELDWGKTNTQQSANEEAAAALARWEQRHLDGPDTAEFVDLEMVNED